MSHFRLKRRVRVLVDHLSLMLSVPPGLILRAVFPHPTSSTCAALVHRLPFHTAAPPAHRRPFFRRWKHFHRRRYLVLVVVSLVLTIEVCGCELAQEEALRVDAAGAGRTMPASLLTGQHLCFHDPVPAANGLPSTTLSGDGQPLLTPPAPQEAQEAKPFPWAIPESVFFIYRSERDGGAGPGRQPPLATAFVLSVPDRRHRGVVRFLVTARHVVDPRWARCAESDPSSIDLRLNRRSGGVGYETVSLQSPDGHRRFFIPSDPTADIAVMLLDQRLIPKIDEYKFIDVPFRMLPTDAETRQFRTSQQVITARAGARPSSESGNFPVFDGGVLSKMPAEAVNVQCGAAGELESQTKPLHVWFINAGAPQGVSGAPVYAAIARGTDVEKTAVLLGVQSIAWPDQGIAGITPSPVLGDLVQTALREDRARLDFYRGPSLIAKETAPSLY